MHPTIKQALEPFAPKNETEPHTEGPWEWDGTGMILRSKTGVNERGGMTGGVCVAQMWTKPTRADAALIAAAPEMLDALKALTSNLGEGEFISLTRLDAARAAIAKAEGRP